MSDPSAPPESPIQAGPPVVTISGEFGAGREEVGYELAERLGVPCYETKVLDAMVDELTEMKEDLAAERPVMSRFFTDCAKLLSAKKLGKRDEHLPQLVKVVMRIARDGGVIIGRGAHLILAGQHVFRLKVEGGLDYCAKQVAESEGIKFKTAVKLVKEENKKRVSFVKGIYECFSNESTHYDLVLNAESFSREQMVRISMAMMTEAGFSLSGTTTG